MVNKVAKVLIMLTNYYNVYYKNHVNEAENAQEKTEFVIIYDYALYF